MSIEIEGRKLVKHSSGVYIRDWSNDRMTMRDINAYKCLDYKDKVVLDVGGCFGGFAYMAKKWGAKEVHSFEALEENFKTLKYNIDPLDGCTATNKAVVSGDDKTCTFYPPVGKSLGVGARRAVRGRSAIEVEAIKFQQILEDIQPDVIKMDIEGGEYDLLLNTELPNCVKQVVMEIHLFTWDWRHNLAPRILENFSDWEVVRPAKLKNTNPDNTTAAWRRKC